METNGVNSLEDGCGSKAESSCCNETSTQKNAGAACGGATELKGRDSSLYEAAGIGMNNLKDVMTPELKERLEREMAEKRMAHMDAVNNRLAIHILAAVLQENTPMEGNEFAGKLHEMCMEQLSGIGE